MNTAYRRNQLVAAMIASDNSIAAEGAKPLTIAARFEEARELLREQDYGLPRARRRSRRNDFPRTVDAVADGNKLSE